MIARVGIVGAGHIATRYGQVLAGLSAAGELTVTGIADKSLDAARKLATQLQCPAFDSCEALLNYTEPDLVIIATPPDQHEADITACLHKSVAVLCEKPLTTDLASLAAIEACARNSTSPLVMASKYRHLTDVRRALSLHKSGTIGELLEVDICFAKRVDMSARWNSEPSISGGGVLMDNGPHAVDLAQLFLGKVVEVSASRGPAGRSLPVEETVHLLMRSERGVLARAHLSWAVSNFEENFLVVYGTEGTIEVGWKSSRLIATSGAVEVIGDGFDGQAAMAAQVRNVIHASRGAEDWLMTPQDAFATVRVIDAAYRAMDCRTWVPVEAVRLASAC